MKVNHEELELTCRKYGVEFLGVFGSVARGENKPGSDVDLLVRFSPRVKIGYFRLYDIEQALARGFGRKIDLVTQDALNPHIKDKVLSDLQVVYGQP